MYLVISSIFWDVNMAIAVLGLGFEIFPKSANNKIFIFNAGGRFSLFQIFKFRQRWSWEIRPELNFVTWLGCCNFFSCIVHCKSSPRDPGLRLLLVQKWTANVSTGQRIFDDQPFFPRRPICHIMRRVTHRCVSLVSRIICHHNRSNTVWILEPGQYLTTWFVQ